MYQDIKKRYHFSSWGKFTEREASVLLRGFTPWKEDCLNWIQRSKFSLPEAAGRQLLRTIWEDPQEVDARVLVDVHETVSANNARSCLLEVLANNELARLPEGPDELGDVCFVHPEGVPPAIYWVTGNLCVSITSFGIKPIPVLDWGYRLHARMIEKPLIEKFELVLVPEKARMRVREEQVVRTPWKVLSDEGYAKFFATREAELLLKEDGVHVRALQKGTIVVEAFEVEPGRYSAAGRTEIFVS